MQDTITGIFMIRTQTSNLGQKHHPNLSWEEQKNQNVYKHLHLQNQNQNQRPMSDKMRPTIQEMMMKHMTKSDEKIKSLELTMSNLVTLMSQRAQGTLPSQTEANLKEEVNVMTTRSGRPMIELKKKEKVAPPPEHEAFTEESSEKGGIGTSSGKCSLPSENSRQE